jgi:capsid assembly protease
MMLALNAVLSAQWAIDTPYLQTILEIAARENTLTPEAVTAKLGRPLENTRAVSIRDGVAVIPVTGPIFPRANLFTQVSGGTSVDVMARDFHAALDDPAVRAILLDVDSPGGQATGVNELANMIHAARGDKPITAYVSGSAASGAYWIASAADQIVADATAGLGSIGVVAGYRDTSARDEKAGVKSVEIVSSQSPNKRLDLSTDEGRKQIQDRVDAIAEVFVTTVARNRSVDPDTVLRDFGAGGILIGADAVNAGLADKLGSFENVLAELATRTLGRRKGDDLMADQNTEPAAIAVAGIDPERITASFIAEKFPQIAKELRTAGIDAAVSEALAAERSRVAALEEIAFAGNDELLSKAKADGMTVEAFAIEQAKAHKVNQKRYADRIEGDEEALPVVTNDPGPGTESLSADAPIEDRAKQTWDRDSNLRAEFGDSFDRYLAFARADESGRARILNK